MARKLNMAFLVAMAIATLVQISTAQTTTVHVVGDAMGWTVPPGGATAYSTWAANNTFRVGDILVFNFASGRHDVAEVNKAAFDACNTASPISKQTNSPANITLSSGEHYYICTFTGHCGGGQKLAVNVTSGASSPAPQPATPSPVPTPTPTPTSSTPPASTPTSSPTPTPTSSPTPTPTSSPPPTPTPTSSPPPSSSPTSSPPPSSDSPPPQSPTTPSSPSPNGATPPSPPGNSAKSLGVALSSTFLAIFVAFLY